MELVYNDMHMNIVIRCRVHVPGFIRVLLSGGRCVCVWKRVVIAIWQREIYPLPCRNPTYINISYFHYHGITITIELEEITDEMRRILKLLSINLTRISEFAGKTGFLYGSCKWRIQHIFSELYTVQEHIKP